MVRSDGGVIWIKDVVAVERENGVPVTLRGFLIDVTEERNVVAALEAAEGTLRGVLQEVPDALFLISGDGRILQTNRMAAELFGYSQEELLASTVERLVPEGLGARHAAHRREFSKNATRRPMGVGLDLLARRRDGSEFPVEISLGPLGLGTEEMVLASIRDMTERKRLESELRERERLLRQMSNVLPALIAMTDKDLRYRYVNDQYAKWFDVDPVQVLGRTVRDVVGEDLFARVLPGIKTVLGGSPVHFEMDFPSPVGPALPTDISLIPLYDVDGVISGYFFIGFDVSARAEAEQADRLHRDALAHVSRVATMGELAASLAHELNQPLAAIVVNAQAARRFLAAPSPDLGEVDGALGDIAGDAKRAGDVIRGMRSLLQKGDHHDEPVDVDTLVSETVEMLRSDAIAREVTVNVDLAGNLPVISGDPIQLKQVVLNLMLNAFEAVSAAGRPPGRLSIKTSGAAGHVEIMLADNGPGFPDDIEEQAFAPFVSTKPNGLGMGLSISRTIVEAQNGRLLAGNNSHGGATVRIILPYPPQEPPG